MKSLRILQVIESLNPLRGGVVEAVRHLSCALEELGHQVEFVVADNAGDAYVKGFPLRTHALGAGWSPVQPSLSGRCLRQNKLIFHHRLIGWLRREAPCYDWVIANGIWHYDGFAVWKALRGGSIPYAVFPHGSLAPWLNTTSRVKYFGKQLHWQLVGHRLLSDARAVLYSCEDERRSAPQAFQPYRCHEVVVGGGIAPPPAPASDSAPREELVCRFPNLLGKRLIVSLGRITPIKGYDIAIEAFAQVGRAVPSLHLVIAGPDEGSQKGLVDLSIRLGIADRITWTGLISGPLKWSLLRSAELMFAPSHTESFGVSIVESLACGVPVLISNKVGIWHEIYSDRAGFVGADSTPEITRSLRQWLELDPGERQAFGRRALECFQRRFDIKRTAERVNAVLTESGSLERQYQARAN